MTAITGNSITGITTAIDPTDVVNKQYVDDKFGSSLPTQTGNVGKFLTTTDGTTTSWDYVSNYQEFTTTGAQTFTVPSQANLLYIEATGAGGGGSTGTTGSTFAKNGLNWALRTSGFGSSSITNITSNGSNYVASGASYLAYSTDNITWVSRTSGFGTSSINGATYFNSEYLIGGRTETISWTLRTTGFGVTCSTSLYANNFYIIGGSSGRISVSTDSINWVLRTSGTATQIGSFFGGNGLVYSGSLYVASGLAGLVIVSTNTISWTIRTAGSGSDLRGVAYGTQPTETYMIAGTNSVIRTSTDSIAWTLRTSGFGTSNINTCLYNDSTTEKYIAGSVGGLIRTSTDAIVWTSRTSGFGTTAVVKLVYGTVFVAGSESGSVINSSTDAIVWTLRTLGFSATGMWGLAYDNGIYVLGTSNSATLTSTDAITWVMRTSSYSQIIYTVSAGNNVWLFGKQDGNVHTSTQTILSSYGNGSLLRASTDSVSWTTRTNNTLNSQTITLLSSSGSYAFAHGTNYMDEYDFLNVSTDNIVWELRTSGFGRNQIASFIYDGAIYIAGGASGTLTTSTDTVSWSLRTSGTISYINDLEYLNSIYLYSTPLVSGPATTLTITNTLLGAQSLTSSTTPTTGSNDQGFWSLTLPWSIIYNGTFYTDVYVSTNSMLTFGGTSYESPYTNALSATNPANPKIMIGAADNSCQRIYYGTEGSAPNRTYRIRFEGTAATTGVLGSPNIIWEATFYEEVPGQIDITIGSRRLGAVDGAYTASALIAAGNIRFGLGTRFLWLTSLYSSTDAITWTSRTSGFGSTGINTIAYSNTANNFVIGGDSGTLSTSTDGIVWRINTSNTTSNLLTSVHASNTYLVAGASGTLVEADTQLSGTGGSGGSYTSWYIPKSIVTSNITVNPGVGGSGPTSENTSGSAGAGTTISWTGPGGTYTLVANGGGAGGVAGIAQTNITSYFYTTAGLAGAVGAGITATAQVNSFQSTGGGSGAATTSTSGGDGGTISFYGNTIFSAGGDNTGTNGVTGIAITSLPYGYGGGGGGAGASTAGNGGNGNRGGGGGGGAVISNAYGNGGNGGDGFVRITWW